MTTITGTILLPNGDPYKGRVKFTPSNTPAAVIVAPTSVMLTKEQVFACDDAGELVSCSLQPLTYTVRFDTTQLDTIFGFEVPDSLVDQDFALIASATINISGSPMSSPSISALVNVAALKALTAHYQYHIQHVLGVLTPGDGGQGDWYYDETSTATSDNYFVATPNDVTGAGRWLKL